MAQTEARKKNYTRRFFFFPPSYMLRLSAIALLFTATQLLLTMAAQQKILLPFTFFSLFIAQNCPSGSYVI